jgi:hypothetical protein
VTANLDTFLKFLMHIHTQYILYLGFFLVNIEWEEVVDRVRFIEVRKHVNMRKGADRIVI